jgi:hypothetical protein
MWKSMLKFVGDHLIYMYLHVLLKTHQVRGAMEKYPAYQGIFAKLSFGESQMLDKAFYEEEVKRLTLTFEQQVCITLIHLSMLFFLAWPQHMQVTSLWNCLHAVISSIIASKSSVTNDNVGSKPTQLALLQESMIFVLNT